MIRELTWTRLKHNELSASSKVAVHWNDQKKKKKNQLRKDKTLSIWSSLKDEMQQGEKLWEKLSFQISEDLLLFNTELCSTGNFTPQDCQTHSLGSKCSGLESKFHSGTKRRSGDCFYFFRVLLKNTKKMSQTEKSSCETVKYFKGWQRNTMWEGRDDQSQLFSEYWKPLK